MCQTPSTCTSISIQWYPQALVLISSTAGGARVLYSLRANSSKPAPVPRLLHDGVKACAPDMGELPYELAAHTEITSEHPARAGKVQEADAKYVNPACAPEMGELSYELAAHTEITSEHPARAGKVQEADAKYVNPIPISTGKRTSLTGPPNISLACGTHLGSRAGIQSPWRCQLLPAIPGCTEFTVGRSGPQLLRVVLAMEKGSILAQRKKSGAILRHNTDKVPQLALHRGCRCAFEDIRCACNDTSQNGL
ncbi:hypothetical protein GQ54DRAFT_304166 [Martensiomyces pterosporus]|nr:hypothetical protein GQ54DRAFT_304166 [Martensiomyces pterosporus]